MLLNFSVQNLFPENLIEQTQNSPISVLALDSNYRIIAKSKSASDVIKGLRIGRTVSGLPVYDLEDMATGDIKSFTVQGRSYTVNTTVVKGNGCYALVLNGNMDDLVDRFRSASGYDVQLAVPTNKLPLNNDKLLIVEMLKEQAKPRRLGFFDINQLLLQITEEISRRLDNTKINLSVNKNGNCTVNGSEKDFITAVSYISIYCATLAKGNDINIGLEEKEGAAFLTVSAHVCCQDQTLLRSLNKVKDGLTDAECLFRYINLIANGNLWDCRGYIKDNRINFMLAMPLAAGCKEYLLKDTVTQFISIAVAQIISEYSI